ncbi:NAD-dependent epimerase/dehydratase family protein [Celeribacter sp. ULVN23_4]
MPDHRAVFLGASGRIGRLLRAAERLAPCEGVCFQWQYRAERPFDENAFLWPDFSAPQPLVLAQQTHGVETLVIFSGASGAKDDPKAMQAHVTHVDHALTAAVRAGIPRVFVASSSAVYGTGRGHPFREEDTRAPVDAYGCAKVEMEDLCARRAKTEGIEICALRIGNVAGADMLLTNAAARTDSPLPLDIFPNGREPERSYIGPITLLSVLRCLVLTREDLPPALNLAGTPPVAMSDLLDAANVPWIGCAREDTGHQNITLETTRLAALCPSVDLGGDAKHIVEEWQAVRAIS